MTALLIACLCSLLSANALANPINLPSAGYEIHTSNLRAHVNFLSSDMLGGRLTGTDGEKLATDYVANIFHQLKLEPAGDNGTFFQTYHFIAGVTLGSNNSLSITNQNGATKKLLLNRDWRPLSFSDSASFKSSMNNSSWVITFVQNRQLNPSSLRYKAFLAKEQGAKGIIFVSDQLIPFSYDTSSSNAGIVALSVKNNIENNNQIDGQIDIKKITRLGRNVLAKLNVSPNTSKMIIIGAHIDHLGYGNVSGSRARASETGWIHPGADDNASGVACVLETAAMLTDLKARGKLHGDKDILFAAWSGEEIGILGSSHFINNFITNSKNKSLRPGIDAAINLDMVGHLNKKLVLQGVGSSTDWPNIINLIKTNHSISLITQNDPYLPTDSTSFYLHGVPILNLFTGANDNYHTPRDKPETLNYAGIKKRI